MLFIVFFIEEFFKFLDLEKNKNKNNIDNMPIGNSIYPLNRLFKKGDVIN